MAVKIRCPNPACGRSGSVSEDSLGQRGRCPKCGTIFLLSPPTNDSVPPPSSSSQRTSNVSTSGTGLPRQIGRFQIRAQLGAGAFGAVYRAYDPQLDREVALKVPHPGTLENSKAVDRFLR